MSCMSSSPIESDLCSDEMSSNTEEQARRQSLLEQEEEDKEEESLPQAPPIKVKKKPGRKPKPVSEDFRKEQNRAAQRAFRERREQHLKDIEDDLQKVKDQRDQLLAENFKLLNENDILRVENWYMKGTLLSVQLFCLEKGYVIPHHCPYIEKNIMDKMEESVPHSVSVYRDQKKKNKLKLSKNNPLSMHTTTEGEVDTDLPPGSLIITANDIKSVPMNQPLLGKKKRTYDQFESDYLTQENNSRLKKPYQQGKTAEDLPMPRPQPVVKLPDDSNLAAIQILRLHFNLQSASLQISKLPYTIRPTLLQLMIPHDPRIDLIPTAQMRDRMILFRDQFDLDECFRCLLGGAGFLGGDPTLSGNWRLSDEFFDKFWFLTIDYNRRGRSRDPKIQGLEQIQKNMWNVRFFVFTPNLEFQYPVNGILDSFLAQLHDV
ncbi:hypothetical protein K501DRAFT_325860 [Backusella circina FSU 941]|nr:hypothetical protein K501DRAFT_325860 [Backusella circina FSU 941]